MALTHVARQPIFDRSLSVVGYELLYRADGVTNEAIFSDDGVATASVLVSAFSGIPLQSLLDDKPASIKISKDLLFNDIPNLFAPDRAVIEVHDDSGEDPDVQFALTELHRQGYRITLEGWDSTRPPSALWDLARTIKVDVRTLSAAHAKSHTEIIHSRGLRALAEMVETRQQFEQCKEAGFDEFQGNFLSKPEIVEHRNVSPRSMDMLRILQALQDPETSADDLALVIRRDVGLSVRLLRVANSAFFALPRRVESISEAVVLLGTRRIARWAVLFSMSAVPSKPPALTSTGLARARMCEILAKHQRHQPTQAFFTVGLFSILDALLDLPMETVLSALPLSADLNGALLHRQGVLGNTLSVVCAYEVGDWAHIDRVEIDQRVVRGAFIDACSWADAASRQMSA